MATEYLVISSVSLDTPAWFVNDLSPLYESADQRGEDRIIPGVAGVLAFPRRATVTRKNLPMSIFGDADRTGAPYGDAHAGLQANIEYLLANVVEPITTGDGTRPATLHTAAGGTKTANVHVIGLSLGTEGEGPFACRAVLSISIPSGRFV